MSVADPAENLAAVAQETDKAVRQARERLVTAVRKASRDGMSQKEIARQIGRSQPEVSRLLRFHGTTPLARRLRSARHEVIETVKAAGGSNVRVFGSVATGREHEGSDIDLLFHMDQPLGLMDLAGLEMELGPVLDTDVDLVPDTNIRPTMRERIISEARVTRHNQNVSHCGILSLMWAVYPRRPIEEQGERAGFAPGEDTSQEGDVEGTTVETCPTQTPSP